jgi:hypothetical protein
MLKQPTEVRPGQIYKDLDIRSKTDEFTVLRLETHALHGQKTTYAICARGEKTTRVRVERLLAGPAKSGDRGYQYVGMKR